MNLFFCILRCQIYGRYPRRTFPGVSLKHSLTIAFALENLNLPSFHSNKPAAPVSKPSPAKMCVCVCVCVCEDV